MTASLPCRNVPVYTKSGQHLGRIVDVEVDAGGAHVVYYHVAPAVPLSELWHKRLLVSPRQVISLTAERMTVEDNTVGVPVAGDLAAEPTP